MKKKICDAHSCSVVGSMPQAMSYDLCDTAGDIKPRHNSTKPQGHLNQWAHWARAQGPRIFFLFEGPPTGFGEINNNFFLN